MSSHSGGDFLRVARTGMTQFSISGGVGWEQRNLAHCDATTQLCVLRYRRSGTAPDCAAEQKCILAARLLGAADALRTKFDLARDAADHPAHAPFWHQRRSKLAAGEEAEPTLRAGREMSADEAIAFAPARDVVDLTPNKREREISRYY